MTKKKKKKKNTVSNTCVTYNSVFDTRSQQLNGAGLEAIRIDTDDKVKALGPPVEVHLAHGWVGEVTHLHHLRGVHTTRQHAQEPHKEPRCSITSVNLALCDANGMTKERAT